MKKNLSFFRLELNIIIFKFAFAALFLFSSFISAQDTNWNSTLSVASAPSPFISDWERNPAVGSFTVNYMGTSSITYVLEYEVTSSNWSNAVEGESDEYNFLSAGSRVFTLPDVISWGGSSVDPAFQTLIEETGMLPEDEYVLCVRVKDLGDNLLTESCYDFEIVQPSPPELILPENEALVDAHQPNFIWNPVNVPPAIQSIYHFLLVELLDGQSAFRAIESNIPHHEAEINGLNSYLYPVDALPLERGKSYAWRITATDEDNRPISLNEGKSEIRSFSYGSAGGSLGRDTLVLVPDIAWLINVDDLSASNDGMSLTLDGSCALLLSLPGSSSLSVDVDVNGLSVQLGDFSNPVYLGGSVSGNLFAGDLPEALTGNFFRPRILEFAAPDRLSFQGNFVFGDSNVPLTGELQYNGSQFLGALTANGTEETPLFRIGDDNFNASIIGLEANFPDLNFNLSGGVTVFGNSSGCSLENISLNNDGDFSVDAACAPERDIPLIPGSTLFNLRLGSLGGTFSGNLLTGGLDYDINVNGGLLFQPTDGDSFGAEVTLRIRPGNFEIIDFDSNINMDFARIDLGWLQWSLSNLEVNNLTYSHGDWDFEIATDMQFGFPDFSDAELPEIAGVLFRPDGFTFPSLDLNHFTIPDIDFNGFSISLEGLHVSPFTFDWFNWDPSSIAEMSFGLDIRFNMPNLPEGTPEALRNLNLELHPRFENGNFHVDIPDLNFPEPLSMPLAAGMNFNIASLAGALDTDFDGSLMSFIPDIHFEGDIDLPDAFTCEEGASQIHVNINVDGHGRINGTIEDLVPECPLNLGPISLQATSSRVDFLYDTDQKISIDGSAVISFGDEEIASLEMGYEILHNNLYKLEGEISNPFHFNIPDSSPVLSFLIDGATVRDKILSIDGRQEFNFSGGASMSVTFDNFQIGLLDFSLRGGRVIFDTPFNLQIGGLDGALAFQVLPEGTEMSAETGIMIDLPDDIELNESGLAIHGEGGATIKYNGREVAAIQARFSDDFAFGISPFAITGGICEFFYEEDRIAYVNSDGFFPDADFFLDRILPERIPLPTEDIAYLQIRDGESLLINVSEEEGVLRLSTREGQPIPLVFPGLRFSAPADPQILVSFSVGFDLDAMEFTDGTINAVPPEEEISPFDLSAYGIPFKIDTLNYKQIDGEYVFRLHGLLKLFEEEFSPENAIVLQIGSDGALSGDLDLDIDQTLNMVPGSDRINLAFNHLSGNFNVDLPTRGIDFELALSSAIQINLDEGRQIGATATIEATERGVSVSDYEMDIDDLGEIAMGFFNMEITDIAMPRLEYRGPSDPDPGWDFEFNLDLNLQFPGLGFRIPEIDGIELTRTGFHFPEISMPDLPESLRFNFMGFEFVPLAFRTPAIDFNWFSDDPVSSDWDFRFDFAVNFPEVGNGVGNMENTGLTISDAGYVDGILIGTVEGDFEEGELGLNFGESGLGFGFRHVEGGLYNNEGEQGVRFALNGYLNFPDFMSCEEASEADVSTVDFEFNSGGMITGSIDDFVPPCPINLGFAEFRVTSSSISFSIEDGGQSAALAMTGELSVPTGGDGEPVTAEGSLELNLITGELLDGEIVINGPFTWSLPSENPIFHFTINRAVLNMDGLLIDGESELALEGGASLAVNFNSFLFDYREFNIISGDITIGGNLGLKMSLPEDGGIQWSVIGQHDPLDTDRSAMLGFGGEVVIDAEGVHFSGGANAAIRWDLEHTFESLGLEFTDDFTLRLSPFEVSSGRADLMNDGTMIAYLDDGGFHLGDIFGIIPIPERLPVPSVDIAYIQLKDEEGNPLLETAQDGSDLSLRTRDGSPLSLFIPALANGGDVPRFEVSFDITVNTSTWDLVSGSITLEGTDEEALLDLQERLGIPVKIMRLSYRRSDGHSRFSADARVTLPDALGGLPIDLSDLSFDENGLTGTVEIGEFSATPDESINELSHVDLGENLRFTLEGAAVEFGDDAGVRFSGNIIPAMMIHEEDTTKIHYAAEWRRAESSFGFSFDFSEGTFFNFGIARFYPEAIHPDPAMRLSFVGSNFEFMLGGRLTVPSFDPDFEIAFRGFTINNDGVSVDAVHLDEGDALQFTLFNSRFRIFDSIPGAEAIGFSYDNATKVLSLTLSGDLSVLDHIVNFTGFTLATDGTISVSSINMLDRPIDIIPTYLSLDTLGIRNVDDMYRLALAGNVHLPESIAETSSFHFGFEIGTDGHFYSNSSDNRVVFIDETPGLGGDDDTEFDLWKATIDPTYLDLSLNFDHMRQSSIRLMADIYWNDDETNKIEFGSRNADGSINQPALEINFSGDIDWGDITVEDTLRFDWDMLQLGLSHVTIHPTISSFSLTLGGYFELNISSVTGRIEISDLVINKDGVDHFPTINDAELRIASIVELQLTSLRYEEGETEVEIESGSMPGADGGGASSETETVRVKSFFSFGASITIADMLSGGIEQFMTYTTMDDEFNLLIKDAYITYSSILDIHVDFIYRTHGSDYYLFAGAHGTIMSYDIILVGQAGHINGKNRFGFFIAVDVSIPIGPVTITGLGGGFFYNPTAETINIIKRLARLDSTGGTNDKIKPADDDTKFAIFLFGKFALVSDAIISGRVLLTVTDTQFYLDGKVVFLSQENSIYGTIHLAIDFDRGEFEGNIKVEVNFVRIITGHGEIAAYVYDSDTWGVNGLVDIEVLRIIDINSNFFIGPSGFLVSLEASVSFDIWIIDISAGIEIKIWYLEDSWGLYAKVWVRVEVLGGIAGAEGWLKGAMFGTAGHNYMYGVAGLRVWLLAWDWEGSVWGKIDNGRTSGGWGTDSDMEALIEEAGETAEAAEQARDEMQNELNSHAVPGKEFSNEELASAFETLSKFGRYLRYGTPAQRIAAAIVLLSLESIEESGPYYNYRRERTAREREIEEYSIQTYVGEGAPDMEEMERQSVFIDSLLSQFNVARTNLLNKLSQGIEGIENVSAEIKEAGECPVTGENFGDPERIDTDGDGIPDNTVSQPGFQFDTDVDAANRSNLEDSRQAIANYERNVFIQIGKLDNNIVILESMIFGGDADTSAGGGSSGSGTGGRTFGGGAVGGKFGGGSGSSIPSSGSGFFSNPSFTFSPVLSMIGGLVPVDGGAEGFSRGFASYYHSIDAAFISQYKYYRELYDWSVDRLNVIEETNESAFHSELETKAGNIFDDDWRGVRELSANRVYFLSFLATNDGGLANTEKINAINVFNTNHDRLGESRFREWAIEQNIQYGMDLWINIPKVGLAAMQDTCDEKSDITVEAKLALLGDLSSSQAALTRKIGGLYDKLSSFVEIKYDLFDRLIKRRNASSEFIDSSVSTDYLRNQKTILQNKMRLPVISSLNYTVSDRGYYSEAALNWTITGKGALRAKSMITFRSGNNPRIVNPGKQAVGSLNNFSLLYAPAVSQVSYSGGGATVSFGTTRFTVYVKNGLGYTIRRNVSFTPDCSFTSEGTGAGDSGSAEPDTSPPSVSKINYPYFQDPSTKGGRTSYRIYFSHDTSTVSASWRAYDYESGIREYRYKFIKSVDPSGGSGSGKGGVMPPPGGIGGDFSEWENNYGRDNVEIHGLRLKHNRFYKLMVVAQNGDFLWSRDTMGVSQYLKIDVTPPTAPRRSVGFGGGGFGGAGDLGGFGFGGFPPPVYPVNPPVVLPEPLGGYALPPMWLNNSDIEESFSWGAASDGESGINHYEYKVTKTTDETKTSEWINAGDRLSVTLRNDVEGMNNVMTYLDSFYLDVRAVNGAGNKSVNNLRIKFRPQDSTPPSAPNVSMAYSEDRSRIYLVFSDFARDSQTGILRYEVAIGSAPNGTFDILNWNDSLYFSPFSIRANFTYRLPALPSVPECYIAVRAVNGQGKAGEFCYTGPKFSDTTPPIRPRVTVSQFNILSRIYLRLHYSLLSDPESGIISVDYKIEKITYSSKGGFLIPVYRTIIDWTSSGVDGVSVCASCRGLMRGDNVRVSVRAKNGAYLYSPVFRTNYLIH